MKQRDIQSKIDFFMDNQKKLNRLKKYSFSELSSNFERVDSAIYRLQTSIEALLDIARYIISDLGLRVPSTSAEVIKILLEEEFIAPKHAKQYIQMVGFRNRVVHEYNSVDIEKLSELLQEDIEDLKKLFTALLEIVNEYEDKEDLSSSVRFSL